MDRTYTLTEYFLYCTHTQSSSLMSEHFVLKYMRGERETAKMGQRDSRHLAAQLIRAF